MPDRFINTDQITNTADTHAVSGLLVSEQVFVNANIRVTAEGQRSDGIHSDVANNIVTVRSGAVVSSVFGNGIILAGTVNGIGAHLISVEAGAVVRATGTEAGLVMLGSNDRLTNAGTITGATGAKIGSVFGSGGWVEQSGSMIGTNGNGLELSGDALLTNTGLIQGTAAAIAGSNARLLVITNYGSIIGSAYAIYGAFSANHSINNYGRMEGKIELGSGKDLYDGSHGVLVGTLSMGAGDDRVYGGSASETIWGEAGNDTIDGGGGNDVAVYSNTVGNYTITHNSNGTVTVSDNSGTDGTDLLKNVRFAKFSGTNVTVALHNAAPINLSLSKTSFAEDTPVTGIVASLSAFDADGDALTYSLTGNPSGLFRLDGTNVVLAGGADFEAASHHSITVTAKDAYGGEVTKTFDLSVTNVVETNPLTLRGTRGADRLTGESGSDKLYGGLGKDILIGGAGRDIFVFDTRPSKNTNVDKIVDFNPRDDTIHLAKSVFSKISKKGVLAKTAFWTGNKAHDASDRIIYDKNKGALFYDQDGNGSKAAVQFGTVGKKLALKASDFYVL